MQFPVKQPTAKAQLFQENLSEFRFLSHLSEVQAWNMKVKNANLPWCRWYKWSDLSSEVKAFMKLVMRTIEEMSLGDQSRIMSIGFTPLQHCVQSTPDGAELQITFFRGGGWA